MIPAVPAPATVHGLGHGHGAVKDFLFGRFMETVQGTMTKNLLIVGPQCDINRFSVDN